MKVQKFKRGQIWWYKTGIKFDGSTYNEGKPRPIIIMSNDLANANSNCLIGIPCTTQEKKEMPTHLKFYLDNTPNIALAENLMSINTDKLTDYIGMVDEDLLVRLEQITRIALGLEQPDREIFIKEPKQKPLNLKQYIDEKVDIETEKVEPVFADDTPLEEKLSTRKAYEGVGKKGHQKYTVEQMQEFIDDCENHTIAWVTKKYNCSSEKATSNKLYRFRKFLKENP